MSTLKTRLAHLPKPTQATARYSVGMFSAGEARNDRWQNLAHLAQALVAQSTTGEVKAETLAAIAEIVPALSDLESFHAYPGETMLAALKEAMGRRDYSSFSRLPSRIA